MAKNNTSHNGHSVYQAIYMANYRHTYSTYIMNVGILVLKDKYFFNVYVFDLYIHKIFHLYLHVSMGDPYA